MEGSGIRRTVLRWPPARTDHAGRESWNFATSLGLSQLVQQATRVPDVDGHIANCLDLLLTTDPDRYSVQVSSPLGTSDHCLVKSVSSYSPPDHKSQGVRRVWRYKSADWDEMRQFFASYPWRQICFGSGDPSSCAEAVTDVAEKNKHSAYLSWVEARHRKASDINLKKEALSRAAKSYKKTLRRAGFDRIQQIGTKLSAQPSGSRAFWSLAKAAKTVESNFCRPSLPPLVKPDGSLTHAGKEKADLIASLFAHNSRLDPGSNTPPSLPHCETSITEVRIKNREVLKALRSLDVKKAYGPDGIPALVLKACAPELSPVLTRLFRLSFETGVVPKSWKLANVQPIPKKGSRADPANYRPISITSILCKTMERILNARLMAYLEQNDLLSDRQYGFRRNRSTGDLLVYATHLWGEALENNGEALAVSLDISKAFDRVWHASLLSKLPAYGISPGLIGWVKDFLSERSLRVVVEGCSSEPLTTSAGVPQESVLSATLFLLHINDLLMPGIGYADDSTVVERYQPSLRISRDYIQSEREAMVERLNLTLQAVSERGDANLVRFNASKTQACLFSAKRSPSNLAPTFQNVSLEYTDRLRLLGVEISSNLNFGRFIESKARAAARKLGVLAKVRRYFTPGQLLTLYKAQVRSCVEFCCHIWAGATKCHLAALDSMERRAERLIGCILASVRWSCII
ncbi:unnamed protein product, partial [Iphiclides podalirius]